MTLIYRAVTSAIATIALLFYAVMPVFAVTTLEISGNGADSQNEAEVEVENTVTVVQSNNADIDNDVYVDANTGDNEAEKNNGGDVSINTGDATATVDVTNHANMNVASVENCGTCNGDVDIVIADNGAQSENEVEVEHESEVAIYQDNYADIDNDVYVDANTGDNEAEKNNGGDVSINTGDADTSVGIVNAVNANIAMLLGNGDNSNGVSAQIMDNGAESENEIDLEFERSVLLVQENDADIDNDVDVDADTGDNEAEKNNGGNVDIETGDINSDVSLDNFANFNFADIECCIFDVSGLIANNGAQSENEIEAEFENELEVFQGGEGDGNEADLDNDVDVDADTGDNEAEKNNGEDGNFSVATGDTLSEVSIGNGVNANLFSQGGEAELPEDFSFFFDLSSLLGFLDLA